MPTISIGVAGWSYDDWRDAVYRIPPSRTPDLFGYTGEDGGGQKARYVRDELAFLARYVDMIEINSSFYKTPSAIRPTTTTTATRRSPTSPSAAEPRPTPSSR